MATLSSAQARASATLTDRFRQQEAREAAKYAALVSLYYLQRVDPESPASIAEWLDLMVPSLIRASDSSADRATAFFTALRTLETPGAEPFRATPAKGFVDDGVAKSLQTVGPYEYVNKARDIRSLKVTPQQERALLRQAKEATTSAVAGSVLRHAQAGGRQTLHDAATEDRVALGYVRVTKAEPCYFCAALASRGLRYRAFKEGSFDLSDSRFSGDGDAKVHDNCGCSLKPVYAQNDPLVARTEKFADQWSLWGAGGGDAMLRFRRGYEHLRKTGEYLTWEQANEGLRAT